MIVEVSEERIIAIAEKQIEVYVNNIMRGFSRDNVIDSRGYDYRFEQVVERVLTLYFNTHYEDMVKPIIQSTIKDVVQNGLAERIVRELKDFISDD